MIARLVWDRFRQDWLQFGRMSVWTVVSAVPALLPLPIVGAWYLGGYISSRLESGPPTPADAMDASASMNAGVIFMLLLVAVTIVIAAALQAGLMAQVVAFRRGQAFGFRTFWTGVWRHSAPLLLPAVFWGGLQSLNAGSFLTEPLRQAALALVVAFLALHLGIYPAYLIVADDMGGLSAMGRGLRILVAQPREALLGVFALWVMQLAVMLLGELVAFASPFLLLPWAIVLMFYVPLVPYYFAERFEQKLRPLLN